MCELEKHILSIIKAEGYMVANDNRVYWVDPVLYRVAISKLLEQRKIVRRDCEGLAYELA